MGDPAAANWKERFRPVIMGTMTDTAEMWNTEMGISFDVRNLFVPDVLEDEEQFFAQWFEKYMDTFSEPMLNTTRGNLHKILEQADFNGWTVDQVRKQLGLDFDRYLTEGFSVDGMRLTDKEKEWFTARRPQYRRENIARTETMKAANGGTFELFKAWEVVELKEWLSTNDDRTRPTHVRAGAQYSEGGNPGPIPLDEPFVIGGQQMMYPLDGSLGAHVREIAQCRCAMAPVISEEEVEIPDTERPLSRDETEIPKTLEELKPIIDAAIRAGDPTGSGMKEMYDQLNTELKKERLKNTALWDNFGKTKEQATPQDWLNLADILEQEGYTLYKKYSKEGITLDVAEKRGAKLGDYMNIGKEIVQVRQGQFSARAAQRMQGEIWSGAKEELREAQLSFLTDVGFAKDELAQADFFQLQKIIAEAGDKEVRRTRRGSVSKVDGVPPEARVRVTEDVDFDKAATAYNASIEPLQLPTLDAFGKMELADELRSTYTTDESAGDVWPTEDWSDANDWTDIDEIEPEPEEDWFTSF